MEQNKRVEKMTRNPVVEFGNRLLVLLAHALTILTDLLKPLLFQRAP